MVNCIYLSVHVCVNVTILSSGSQITDTTQIVTYSFKTDLSKQCIRSKTKGKGMSTGSAYARAKENSRFPGNLAWDPYNVPTPTRCGCVPERIACEKVCVCHEKIVERTGSWKREVLRRKRIHCGGRVEDVENRHRGDVDRAKREL